MEIIPALLALNTQELDQLGQTIAGFSSRVHVDIADGVFVPSTTVNVEDVAAWAKTTNLEVDVHLMIKHPEFSIERWLAAVPNARSVIFHMEATDKALQIINTIHQAGKQAGVSINPATESSVLYPVIGQADFVHFMTVQPGFYGADFQEHVVEKIRHFHERQASAHISVDGGMNPTRALLLSTAGVSSFVVGSYIMKSEDPAKAYNEFNV